MSAPPPIASPNRLSVRDYFLKNLNVRKEVQMDITQEFKKGYKTSEFWVTVVAVLAPPIALFSGYDLDVEGVTTLIGSIFSAIAYAGSRTWLKRKRIDGVTSGT